MKAACFELTAKYKCDSCTSEHYYDLDYVNSIGKILCYCGKILVLDPISDIKIDTTYEEAGSKAKTHTTKSKRKNQDDKSEEYINQAISILINLGWKKNKATNRSHEAYKEWLNKGEEGYSEDSFENFANYLILNK